MMNVDPIITFSDGMQLLVSTQYSREGGFACELYLSNPSPGGRDAKNLRSVSGRMEASTCRQAQDIACNQARRLYPEQNVTIKTPPYLVWSGPNLPPAPDVGWRRSV